MPSFCAVLDCIDKYGHGRAVPFHKFPTKNKELLEKWIYFTQRPKDWRPSRWTSVCGLHFRDEDYRCLEQKKLLKKTAVPSVRATKNGTSIQKSTESSKKENYNYDIDLLAEKESDECELGNTVKHLGKPNSKCRFCGCGTTNYDSFAGNFEIYGVIQKCLPTLSIRQDDDMPKEICTKCLKRMEGFASFIDKVLETQAALLRQFRQEKGSAKPMERVLKIKQEPVVRVKQENFEDVNALFPDEVDDGGEQDNDASNTESQLDQKIQFCDFPVLNDQDLINNCDIMEIINLSDPFIDITNCENTLADEAHQAQQDIPTIASRVPSKSVLQSAHELLQSHMLIEEHNYAYAAEDFKEEWQIKNCYKTEKIEAEEFDDQADQSSFNCNLVENEQNNCDLGSFIDEINAADVAAITTVETTAFTPNEMERSIKPIVTSVSSFKENTITTYPPETSFAADADQQQVNPQTTTSRKRPNIVVLNESIVQSSHTFQLQACTICQSKFIGVDSLNQHYATHAMEAPAAPLPQPIAPMVTVPTANITATTWQPNIPQKNINFTAESCKVEKDATFDYNNQRACNQNYNGSTESVTVTANIDVSNKRSSKNEIKILDMQQSFLHEYNYPNLIRFDQQSNMNFNTSQINAISAFPLQPQTHTFPTVAPTNAVITAQKNLPEAPSTPDVLTVKYMALQKSYDRLRLKCERLECKTRSKKILKRRSSFNCRICSTKFSTIFQLLRHKQTAPFHEPLKRRANFFASCPGCEKFFCHKIALFNHMRYICQALPLCWFKSQLRTFKCRCCRQITFTHWRLYRKHEIKCRQNRKFKLKETQNLADNIRLKSTADPNAVQSQKVTNQTTKAHNQPKVRTVQSARNRSQAATYTCAVCQKVFPSSSSLIQHKITHSNLRSFECEICKRIFKRRNGLTQHVKGFHLKIKPFECPVCLRSFALKGDVKRCKHSLINRKKAKAKEINKMDS